MTARVRDRRTRTAPTLAESVYDRLSIEGGWITAACLAMIMGRPEESVRRILYRLRMEGHAESRTVDLAKVGTGTRPHRLESRQEWRTT
jgi:hypothetical protein